MTEALLKPHQRRHAQKRQAILDASRKIISEQGVSGLSMRSIADYIDYSAAGLYEYFDSKEAIIDALCDQGHERLTAAMRAVDSTLPEKAYMHGLGQAYIDFALQHPDYFTLMFSAAARRDMTEIMSDGSSYPVLLGGIQRGIESGAFKTREGFGLEEMGFNAWSLVHGLAMLRITMLRDLSSDLAVPSQRALENLLRGFAG